MREWADAKDEPNERYRKAFVWYDADEADKSKGYKLQIADIVDGRLKAVPRGIMSAAGVMQGARGEAELPKGDIEPVKNHLARYSAKMDATTPPWDKD